MPTIMTDEQIDALTMADVEAAKAASLANRETRAGLSTRDFILCQCTDKAHLSAAKAHLRDHYKTPQSKSLGVVQAEVTYPGDRLVVFEFDINPAMVMQGDRWLPGVTLRGDAFDGQAIEYAINEGRAAEGWWNDVDIDPANEDAIVRWRVRPEGIARLRRYGIVEPPAFDRPALETMIRAIGIGFHADTPIEDYDLPADDAAKLDTLLTACSAAGQDANAIAIEVLDLNP